MNHTPGPWIAGPVFAKQEGRAIFFTDETLPGKWQKRLDDKSGVFSDANARLIAAAPDLMKSLHAMVVWYGLRGEKDELLPSDEQPSEVREAMKAIARARGEE